MEHASMPMSQNKIRQIIREELKKKKRLAEDVDHSGIRDVVNGASKLLAAVEGFQEHASPSMTHAVTPHIDAIRAVLEDMVSTPGSYVQKAVAEPKVVQLRAVKSESKKLREATGGDGKLERVDQSNWQHLEVGNTYLCKTGRDKVLAKFLGWVDESGVDSDSEDPNVTNLKFADVSDGMEWEAYFSGGKFAAGSSADTLFVKESD